MDKDIDITDSAELAKIFLQYTAIRVGALPPGNATRIGVALLSRLLEDVFRQGAVEMAKEIHVPMELIGDIYKWPTFHMTLTKEGFKS